MLQQILCNGDNLIELNNGVVNNANDSGIVIERGAAGDNVYGWDESEDAFILGTRIVKYTGMNHK